MDELELSYVASTMLLAALIILPPAVSRLPEGAALAAACAALAAAVLIPARALKKAGILFKGLKASDLWYLASADLFRSLAVVGFGAGWIPLSLRTLGAGAGIGAVFLLLSITWAVGLAAAETRRVEGLRPRIVPWAGTVGYLLLWLAGTLELDGTSWMEATLFLTVAIGLGAALLTACLGAALSPRRFGGEFAWRGPILRIAPAVAGSALMTAGLEGPILAAVFIYCTTVLMGSIKICQRVGPLATWAYVVIFPLNPLVLRGLILKLSIVLAP